MKLREEIENVLYNSNGHCGGLSECEIIANTHAIGFAEWFVDECNEVFGIKNKYYYKGTLYTFSELLEIYNQQNNLKQ